MKVILLTDVPKVGKKHEVKDFKEGYAQNVLLSKGLAELATPPNLLKLETKIRKIKEQKDEEDKKFTELIEGVNNKKIVIKAKANEKGHLFKQVNAHDVMLAIKESSSIDIGQDLIQISHIKEIGEYTITIKKGNKEGKCELKIIAL